MSSKKGSFSERIGRSSRLQLISEEEASKAPLFEKQEYIPFDSFRGSGDTSPTLRLRFKGNVKTVLYSRIKDFDYTFSGKKEELSIYKEKTRIVITGKNLAESCEKLFDFDVKAITPFNEDIHIEPQKGEPIIYDIQAFPYDHEKEEKNSE